LARGQETRLDQNIKELQMAKAVKTKKSGSKKSDTKCAKPAKKAKK